jgi:geranylgeranyl pyrophosphate synthase
VKWTLPVLYAWDDSKNQTIKVTEQNFKEEQQGDATEVTQLLGKKKGFEVTTKDIPNTTISR